MDGETQKRQLGDEWLNWKGEGGDTVQAGKWLYLTYASLVFLISDVIIILFAYLVMPRLAMWHHSLPRIAWIVAGLYVGLTTLWIVQLSLTAIKESRYFVFTRTAKIAFASTFGSSFRLAKLMKIDRDRLGHSFVRVSNAITRALHQPKSEKVLILLPRCLAKEQIQNINALKDEFPIEVAIVGGGEQARKKVWEIRPSAVIGVACERDLVSGIKDIAGRVAVLGIPNQRPEGPCKNTSVDLDELKNAIKFFIKNAS